MAASPGPHGHPGPALPPLGEPRAHTGGGADPRGGCGPTRPHWSLSVWPRCLCAPGQTVNGSLQSNHCVRRETPRGLGKQQTNKNSTETKRARPDDRRDGRGLRRPEAPAQGARGIWWQPAAQRKHAGSGPLPRPRPQAEGRSRSPRGPEPRRRGAGPPNPSRVAVTAVSYEAGLARVTIEAGYEGQQHKSRARGRRHTARHGGRGLTGPWPARRSRGPRCPACSAPSSAPAGPGWASAPPQPGLVRTGWSFVARAAWPTPSSHRPS